MARRCHLQALACLVVPLVIILGAFLNEVKANVGHPTEIFNKSDLEIAESNPRVVGVKKHKNYEIVVYEYDESGEKVGRKRNKDFAGGNVPEIDDNSVEVPTIDEKSSTPRPRTTTSTTKPTSKPTRNYYTIPSPPPTVEAEEEQDPFETSASEESSESVEPPEEKTTTTTTTRKPKPTTTTQSSVTNEKKKKSSTTEKPQLPSPFRSTKPPEKKKPSSSTESSYEDDEYYDEDDEDYEYDSSSGSDERKNKRKMLVSEERPRGSKDKPFPKPFGSGKRKEAEEENEDEYYDEKKSPVNSRRIKSTTSRPRRPSSGKVTPKPFFPIYSAEEDEEYYDDDDDEDDETRTTTKKPSRRNKGKIDNAIKLNRRNSTRNRVEDNETGGDDDEDPWGIDESLKCKDPNDKPGICQEYARCSIFYQELMDDYDYEPIDPADYKCRLPTQIGICCPLVSEEDVMGDEADKMTRYKPIGRRKQKRRVINPQIRRLIKTNLNNSLDFGDFFLEDLNDIEQDLLSRSVQVTRNTPEFGHNRFFPTSKRIRQISNIGLSLLQTSNDITDRLRLTNEIGGQGLRNFKSSNIEALNDRCPFQRPCRTSKYRSADGSCNNLQKPKMGQSLTPLARILEPAYADGRWVPRMSVRGFELPSARLLSQSFIGDRNFPDNRYTLLVMQFGQLLDHDVTSVPVFTFANNSGINCCRNGQFLARNLRHPNCLPIEIPASDPFYSRFGQRCMNFVRSRMAPRIDCSLGYADQMNALTHWIDASNIYGSTVEQMRQLRLFQGGLLRFSELGDGKMLLPIRDVGNGVVDYRAGDDRVNEMTGLMIMHLVWFREHNRIAFELARINPLWTDEELFQEARRILTAEYQHIIYNEWLPIIIGRKYMEKAGIVPLTKGYYKGYDPRIDASIANAFSVAAFRMGHTLVQGLVKLIDEMGRDNEVSVISENDENSRRTRQPNQVDKWLRGMAQQPIQSYDPFVTEHLNGRLFQAAGGTFGMDLSSLNIQRGRDHGVPGYNSYRELCQVGRKARTFDDFKDWIPPETADKLGLFYAHPDDVDLWIGGINERPLPGALVGPTFACIIGDQFTRSKKGDRYFYDIGDHSHSFSPEQLREIRKVTFARILCDNGDDLEALQPAAFLQADFDFNSLVDCKRSTRIPRMNLRLWEKEPTPVL